MLTDRYQWSGGFMGLGNFSLFHDFFLLKFLEPWICSSTVHFTQLNLNMYYLFCREWLIRRDESDSAKFLCDLR